MSVHGIQHCCTNKPNARTHERTNERTRSRPFLTLSKGMMRANSVFKCSQSFTILLLGSSCAIFHIAILNLISLSLSLSVPDACNNVVKDSLMKIPGFCLHVISTPHLQLTCDSSMELDAWMVLRMLFASQGITVWQFDCKGLWCDGFPGPVSYP